MKSKKNSSRDEKSDWRKENERHNQCRRYLKCILQQALKLPKLISLRIESDDTLSEKTSNFLLAHGQKLEHLELKYLHLEKANTRELAKFTELKSLLFKHGHDSSQKDDLKAIANNCKRLESINFEQLVSFDSKDETAKGLHYFFEERKNSLKCLTIESSYNVYSDFFLKNLPLCENMESVRILEAQFLSDYGLDIISQLPKLQTLELGKLKNFEGISKYEYKHLMETPIDLNKFFGQMNTDNLCTLKFFDSPIVTEENFKALSVNGCPKLEKLILEKRSD